MGRLFGWPETAIGFAFGAAYLTVMLFAVPPIIDWLLRRW